MFELTELNPKYAAELAASRLQGDTGRAIPGEASQLRALTLDDGQLSNAESALLLAGLGAILTSLWFTLTAII